MIKRKFSTIDVLGVIAATSCMLHCIFTSTAIILLPYYGQAIWRSDLAHQAFACAAVFFCLTSIYQSYRNNNDWKVLVLFVSGLLFLLTATFILPERLHERYEIYILCIGSSSLVIGHIRNIWQLSQCCDQH